MGGHALGYAEMVSIPSVRTLATLALGLTAVFFLAACGAQEAPAPERTKSTVDVEPEIEATEVLPEFDRSTFSLDDPSSLWVVSNKLRALNPATFEPADLTMPEGVENEFSQPLRQPAARAIESLVQGAEAEGHSLRIISAYRPYSTQVALYEGYVARDGQAEADTYSARPGHSEHQTGLAVDLDDGTGCYLSTCFSQSAAGMWVAEHAFEYGFIIRYPEGSESVTGFMFEPWHLRFVGVELARELQTSGSATLEQFFGLPHAPSYAP